MDSARLPKLTRRDVLKLSAAAGAALAGPWIAGCGDDKGSSAGPPPSEFDRETRTLHLDLSGYDPDAVYRLNAIDSAANLASFAPHDAASRRRLRRGSPQFRDWDDRRLTHYLTADLPAGRVQFIWVTREDAGGESTLVLSTIYVPRYYQLQVAQLMASGMVGAAPRRVPLRVLRDDHVGVSRRDSAISVVYQHPGLIRLDPMQAAIVRALIAGMDDQLDLLEEVIESQGKDWIVREPALDFDGRPALAPWDHQPMIQQNPSDTTLAAAEPIIADALNLINNELSLEGATWHSHTGRTKQVQPSIAGADPAAVRAAVEDDSFRAIPAQPKGATLHGVIIDDFRLNPATRTVDMPVRNTWLRFVAMYAEFHDPAGRLVLPYSDTDSDKTIYAELDLPLGASEDRTYRRCLNVAPTNTDYLGIPFRAEDIVPTQVHVRFPHGASQATVVFGTLGLGDKFAQDEMLGSIATLVVNLAIPGVLIITTVGSSSVKKFADLFKKPALLVRMSTLVPASIYDSFKQSDLRPALYQFGKAALDFCLNGLPLLLETLTQEVGLAQLSQAVPVVGWVIKAARVAAAVSELTQTIYEVTSSPSLFTNVIDLVMSLTVTIKHDPEDFQFPATATHYVLKLLYVGKVAQEITGTITGTRSDPIVEVFTSAPAGGRATLEVDFLTREGWVAGHGASEEFDSTPEHNQQTITIKENLVPLNDKTVYSHKLKLGLDGDRHVWRESAAPTQTRHDLNCDDDSLCELDGITVSQAAAAAGYSWQTRGASTVCGGAPTTAATHRVQSLSIAQSPDAALKVGACSYVGKPLLAYALDAAVNSTKRSFYLDPSRGAYHLRALPLDPATPIDHDSRLSWGAFSQAIDSIAVHPAGHVVGINTNNHRLEILTLPVGAVADDEAHFAALKCGRGTRVGLLDTPIAVAVDQKSLAIYVLEAGATRRVQAFDAYGNQMLVFDSMKSATMSLRRESGAVEYLDLAVESTGYLYVLSYANGGTRASDYRLDLYDPDGTFLSRTGGIAAARLAVDRWRNLFTLNYEPLRGPHGLEPSVSEWIPNTPKGCAPGDPFCERPPGFEG
jgi:hypothetical protein